MKPTYREIAEYLYEVCYTKAEDYAVSEIERHLWAIMYLTEQKDSVNGPDRQTGAERHTRDMAIAELARRLYESRGTLSTNRSVSFT